MTRRQFVAGMSAAKYGVSLEGPRILLRSSGLRKHSRRLLWRRLAAAQEAAEQAALALARNEIDVADQLGAALALFQHDLAAVERFKLDAMRDADNGGLGQSLGRKLHHLVLAFFIERRGRLIQHDDIGVVQKQPREGE